MIVDHFTELPEQYGCAKCGDTKPIGEMVVVRLKTRNKIMLRPRCKKCNNERERGHRREWKRKYLRRWRRDNAELNESYWRGRDRVTQNAYAYKHFRKNHAAVLIQGRMRRQTGMCISLAEARKLLRKYGRCYPTRWGLTPRGLRECERIRSRFRLARKSGKKVEMPRPVEIRMMVYADGCEADPAEGSGPDNFVIAPRLQKQPYQRAAQTLRRWHSEQRNRTEAA